MVYCAAPNCKNKSTDGIRLFRFPRDKKRQHQWVQNCRRDKWQPTDNSKLCERHFEESQFEQNRADGRKLLKWNAVPTLFNAPNPPESVKCKRKPATERHLTFQRSNKATVDKAGSSAMVEGEEYYNAGGGEGEWLEKLDTGQLCRICANPNEYLIPIFEGEGLEHELALKIKKHLPIEVSEADTLPRQVCYQCASTLIAWHDLVICCVEADKKLQELQAEENQDDQTAEAFEAESYDSDTAEGAVENKEDVSVGKEIDKTTKPPTKRTPHLAKEKKLKQKSLVESSCLEKSTEFAESVSKEEKASESVKPNEGASQESSERCHSLPVLSSFRAFHEGKSLLISPHQKDHGDSVSVWIKTENDRCDFCEMIFSKKSDLAEHLAKEHSDEIFHCNKCDQIYRSKDLFIHHLEVHKSCQLPACDMVRNVESPEVPLVPCIKEVYTLAVPLRTKLHAKESEENLHCLCCKKEFKTMLYFNKHMKKHEIEITSDVQTQSTKLKGRQMYECQHCSKKFVLKDSYKSHQRIHTGEKPFTCHICGKQFSHTGGLYYHLKHVHAGVKDHHCDICGRGFALKAAMEDHRRIHTGERPYVCHACGKAFKSKASLYIHSKTHTDSFPHACSYCQRKFRWRQQLLAHHTTHTGEKPHMCDTCGKGFGVKTDLTRHKLTHSDKKPYSCAHCNLNFGQKRYLKNHEKLRHGIHN